MNYTKGDWKVHWDDARNKEDSDLRIKLNEKLCGMEDIAIILAPRSCDVNECEANANLIAAAPDMYEALKGLIKLAGTPDSINPSVTLSDVHSGRFDDAIKALAKAKGKELK